MAQATQHNPEGKPTVTATKWNVCTHTGTDIVGAVLHVFTIDGREMATHPQHHGKTFASSEAAFDYALAVGLTKIWERKS